LERVWKEAESPPPVTIVIVLTEILIGLPRRKLSNGTLESAFLVECLVLYLPPDKTFRSVVL